jgi:hypothetical protein
VEKQKETGQTRRKRDSSNSPLPPVKYNSVHIHGWIILAFASHENLLRRWPVLRGVAPRQRFSLLYWLSFRLSLPRPITPFPPALSLFSLVLSCLPPTHPPDRSTLYLALVALHFSTEHDKSNYIFKLRYTILSPLFHSVFGAISLSTHRLRTCVRAHTR